VSRRLLDCGVQVDEQDLLLLDLHSWYITASGYVATSVWGPPQGCVLLHRLITRAPAGTVVDHISGDKLDNRRTNLRVVDQTLNQANRKHLNRNNSSGVRGVQYTPDLSSKRPWRAQIQSHGRVRHLGLFETKEEAMRARRQAERDLFGELCP
jgi:hypothetical protein